MFGKLFNPEAPFWVGVARFADLVWLNVLFCVTLLPLVTGGAALTALYDTAWRWGEERGRGVTRDYFAAFRDNFVQSTVLWLLVAPVGVLLMAAWIFLPLSELAVLKVLLSLVYMLIFPFVWFLQARFENSFWGTLRNSVLIPLSQLPFAAGVLAINAGILGLSVWTAIELPQILPILVLLGAALPVAASMPLLNRAVSPWSKRPTVAP